MPGAATRAIRDRCLCLHLQRAARAAARRFDEALRPIGLTSGQFSLLNALNRVEPPAIGDVARFLVMDRTTLTAALKPLERAGLVLVTPGQDRRKRILRLTSSGHAKLLQAMPIWRDEHDAMDRLLDPEGPDRLRADLVALSVSEPSL